MSLGGVITEFLAAVGFKADKASLDAALAQVARFGKAIGVTAAGGVASILGVARGFDQLGKAATRLRVPIDRLDELRYIARQTGSSTESLDAALGKMLSRNPRLRDSGAALEYVSRRMRGLSEQARLLYAQRLGIDPTLIPMLTQDVSELRAEYALLAELSGVSNEEAARSSRALLAEVGKVKDTVVALGNSVAVVFIEQLRGDLESLRRAFIHNFALIRESLARVVAFALRLAKAISRLGGRILEFVSSVARGWGRLNEAQKRGIVLLGGLLAAWRLLSKGFLATPVGRLVVALATLFGLAEDFITWMDGGAASIDWSPWEASILAVLDALRPVYHFLKDVFLDLLENSSGTIAVFGGALLGLKVVAGALQALAGPFSLLGGGLKMAGGLIKGLVPVIGFLGTALKGLFAVIMANPVILLIAAIVAAVAGLVWLVWTYWDDIRAAFFSALDWVKDFIAPFITPFFNVLEQLKAAFKQALAFIRALFTGDFAGAGEAGAALFSGLKKALAGAFALLVGILSALFGRLWGWIERTFPDFAAWAKGTVGKIRALFASVASAILARWEGVKTFFARLAARLLNVWRVWVDRIRTLFSAVLDFVRALFTGDLDQILAAGKALFFAWTDGVKGIFTGLIDSIRTLFEGLWGWVSGSFPDFAAWAERSANAIRALLGQALDWVRQRLASLVSILPDWVKEKLALPNAADPSTPQVGGEVAFAPLPPPEPWNGAVLAPSPSAAAALSAGDTNWTLNQNTEIKVQTASGDPQAVGQAIAARQGRINNDAVRYMKHNAG